MFLGRRFFYVCDTCQTEASTANYGGPEGFRYYQNGEGVNHICDACQEVKIAKGEGKKDAKDLKKFLIYLKKEVK